MLLKVAHAYEQHTSWHRKKPEWSQWWSLTVPFLFNNATHLS
jgi:hypothetical protein